MGRRGREDLAGGRRQRRHEEVGVHATASRFWDAVVAGRAHVVVAGLAPELLRAGGDALGAGVSLAGAVVVAVGGASGVNRVRDGDSIVAVTLRAIRVRRTWRWGLCGQKKLRIGLAEPPTPPPHPTLCTHR